MVEATHRVKNSDNVTVGFMISGQFYNINSVKQGMNQISNLTQLKSGAIRASIKLPCIQYKDLMRTRYKQILASNKFKRDIQTDLEYWRKNNYRQVLRLLGPRQIGKTTELLKFAYKNYEYVVYVNLAIDDKFISLMEGKERIPFTSILENYCIISDLPQLINDRRTILIIDEIQISSKVYNYIRKLRDEYKIDIVVTGSYLAITYAKKEYFTPVGTVQDLKMYSLSFEEFTGIFNKRNKLRAMNILDDKVDEDKKYFDKLYNIYRLIGGYPSVIKAYLENNSIESAFQQLDNIIYLIKNESAVYFTNTKQAELFDTVFSQSIVSMCSGNRNINIKQLAEVINRLEKNTKLLASRQEVIDSINWLIFSHIIGTCNHCVDGDMSNIIPSKRIYYTDCGLANRISQISTGINSSNIEGLLTEIFAYNELSRLHVGRDRQLKGEVPSFSTLGQYELDFIEESMDGIIYGIEIKTNSGTTNSLKAYIQNGLIDKGVIAKRTLGGIGNKIITIPIWAIGCKFPYN